MNTTELSQIFKKNTDWETIHYDNAILFIPPIQYGKVVKIHSVDIITIATKLPFLNDTIEHSNIYRFTIFLEGISVSKKSNIISLQNSNSDKHDKENIPRNELNTFIFNKIVELRNIYTDKYGRLYATVYLEHINVNHWLLKHNYAVPSKHSHKRRLSESDSKIHDSPKNYNTSPFFTETPYEIPTSTFLPKIEGSSIKSQQLQQSRYSFLEKKENIIFPKIRDRPDSGNISTTSSLHQTDCFISHNWGQDNKNHKAVSVINEAIRKRGFTTWFDENEIDGNIRFKMAEGIDNTSCIVVFITKEYRDKVNGVDMKDNCKYEFTYAMNQLGSQNMIPVIMQSDMKDTHKWKGELGAALGSMLFIDLSQENISESDLEKKYDELCKRIQKIISRNKKKTHV
jgi:hypothetical protein